MVVSVCQVRPSCFPAECIFFFIFFILCVFAAGFSENHLWLAGVPVSSPASLRFPLAGPQEVLWFYQAQEHMTRHTSQGGRLTPRGEALKGVDGD